MSQLYGTQSGGGWTTFNLPLASTMSGLEQASFDTQLASGATPQTSPINIAQLANQVFFLMSNLSAGKTMVAGTRYYVSAPIQTPTILTGIQLLVGGTGGTDKWIVELHDPTGALVATSDTSGTTAGTAATWQQIAFTAQYTITSANAGLYYLAVQSNGTTATLGCYNSPTSPYLVGSDTGVFGTGASITPPTTYTANLGPIAMVY